MPEAGLGGIPMPGGWTLSGMWVPLCGQTWAGAAACFVGMWALMMAAMMLPALAPLLWRLRLAPAAAAAFVAGYFGIWALLGTAVFALGAAFAQLALAVPALARTVPVLLALVVLAGGAYQFTAAKARQLAFCRPGTAHAALAAAGSAWRRGARLGLHCIRACAGLTAILLAVGVMDLRAMALVAAVTTAERLAPAGEQVAWTAGALSLVAGVCLLTGAAWAS